MNVFLYFYILIIEVNSIYTAPNHKLASEGFTVKHVCMCVCVM